MQNKIFVSIGWKGSFLKAVPVFCVQRISSVQRIIVYLVMYILQPKQNFPQGAVWVQHSCVSRQMEFSCLPLPAPCCTWSPDKVSRQDMDTSLIWLFLPFTLTFKIFLCIQTLLHPTCSSFIMKNDHETPQIINMFCAGTLDKTVVLLLLLDSISSLILPCKSYFAFLLYTCTGISS